MKFFEHPVVQAVVLFCFCLGCPCAFLYVSYVVESEFSRILRWCFCSYGLFLVVTYCLFLYSKLRGS
jgi:hypothetical protein